METKVAAKISNILNVFETGKLNGDYASVSIFDDGKFPDGAYGQRQITYGSKQTTEQSNLNILIKMYVEANGQFAEQLKPYLDKIGVVSLVDDEAFISLLKQAGSDPIMKETQDKFFIQVYFEPAMKWANDNGFVTELGKAIIFDSYVHSGKIRNDIRDMFDEVPPVLGGDEKKWLTQYVNAREKWLLQRSNPNLRKTIYRMKTFRRAIEMNNWDLSLPVYANGLVIKARIKMPIIEPKI